jgi:hypothetical protein
LLRHLEDERRRQIADADVSYEVIDGRRFVVRRLAPSAPIASA